MRPAIGARSVREATLSRSMRTKHSGTRKPTPIMDSTGGGAQVGNAEKMYSWNAGRKLDDTHSPAVESCNLCIKDDLGKGPEGCFSHVHVPADDGATFKLSNQEKVSASSTVVWHSHTRVALPLAICLERLCLPLPQLCLLCELMKYSAEWQQSASSRGIQIMPTHPAEQCRSGPHEAVSSPPLAFHSPPPPLLSSPLLLSLLVASPLLFSSSPLLFYPLLVSSVLLLRGRAFACTQPRAACRLSLRTCEQ